MKKAELKKKVSKIENAVAKAKLDLDDLLEELAEDQGRISDDDVDIVSLFASDLETAIDTARDIR